MKIQTITRFFFTAVLLFIAGVSKATDYYVSASGNDASNGTSTATPWKSLSKVETISNAGTIHAGDRILFKCGDSFTGKVSISSLWGHSAKSGTAANPITLGSYGTGAKPVFLYPQGGSAASESRYLLYFVGIDYWVIDGLNFTDTNTSNNHIAGANNGIPIYLGSYGDAPCNHWLVQNVDISLCGMGVVIVGDYNTVQNCNMSNFKNLKSTPSSVNPYEDYGANPFTLIWASNNTITHNNVSGGWAESMDFGYNGGFCETIGASSNNEISYNTIVDCNGLSEFGQGGNSANNLYAYNKIIDCGAMFWVNGDCQVTNAQFFNNTIIETANSRFAQGSPNAGAGVVSPEALSHLNVDVYMFDYSGSSQTASTVFNLKNNIIQISNPLKITKSGSKLSHDYNVLKLSGGSAFGQTLSSHDKSTSAVIFSNTTSVTTELWDLKPPAGSPPVDAGTDVGFDADFMGNPVPTVPNAGILESTSGGSTLTASSVAGIISCNGGTTTVVVTASGGTGPYSGTGTFTVGAGTYSYTVTDATGTGKTTSVTLAQPSAMIVAVSAGSVTSQSGTTTATVTATGGTPGYTYKLNSGSYQSGNSFTAVGVGSNSVMVKDANGCTSVKSFIVAVSELPLTVNISSGTISCNGETTTVGVTASGGTGPYSGTGTFTVNAGTYTYTITDASGSEETASITVSQPAAINVSLTAGTVASQTATTTAAVAASGGTAPYTYKLNNGSYQSASSFTGVGIGTHSITVKDSKGCTSSRSFTVIVSGVPKLTVTAVAGSINCNGNSTTVTVTATGGTAPYSGTGTFSVNAGTYSYTVTDLNGATGVASVAVSQPAILTMSVTAGTITVNGGSTTITVNAAGGTAFYTYQLDGGVYQTDNTFTGVFAGTHALLVKDYKGCTAIQNNILITQPSGGTSTGVFKLKLISKTNETCKGKKNGTITVNCTGGTAPYTYRINFGSYSSNNYFTNLHPGLYVVTGKSATGETSTLYFYIASSSTVCGNSTGRESSAIVETEKIKLSEIEGLKVNVYPNPTATQFSLVIENGTHEAAQITVMNMNGQIVYQSKTSTYQLKTFGTNFPDGMYIAKITQGYRTQNIKLVKGR